MECCNALEQIAASLRHIESLLQNMPEMCAAALLIEQERKTSAQWAGRKYSDLIDLAEINDR